MARFTVLGAYLETGEPADLLIEAPNAMAAQEIANRDYKVAVSTVDLETDESRTVRRMRTRWERRSQEEGPPAREAFSWRRIGKRILIAGVCVTVPGLCFPPLIAVGGVLFWAGLIIWLIGVFGAESADVAAPAAGPLRFAGWEGLRFYRCRCVDVATGGVFELRLVGEDEKTAAGVAAAWGLRVDGLTETRPRPSNPGGARDFRDGHDRGEVAVCDMADIDAMIGALEVDCGPTDRHFLLMNLIGRAYSLRDVRPDVLYTAERACWQWFMEATVMIRALGRQHGTKDGLLKLGGSPVERLAIILEKRGFVERAAEVCRVASTMPLSQAEREDTLKRLARLEKRAAKR